MAFGKARSNKRSSGSSYTSTVTTIVFIALCVLGVWMMTSNSVIPPETTTRAATSTTTGDYPSTKTSRQTELSNKDSSAVFEDNPGQLPEDAIKSDDSKNTNVEEKSQEDQNLANSESSSETANEAESNISKDKQELVEQEIHAAESNKQESEQERSGGSVVEENPQGLQGKESVEEQEKQKLRETQVSEESTITQNQQVEERVIEQESKHDASTQKSSVGGDSQQTSDDHQGSLQDQISYKDQQQTVQHQQQKEDEQKQEHQQQQKEQSQQLMQEGTSHDQIEHDEALPQQSSTKNDDLPLPQQSSTKNDDQKSQETTTTKTQDQTQNSNSQHESNSNTNIDTKHKEEKATQSNPDDSFLGGETSGIPKESKESKKSWSTQADQSENQKERRNNGPGDQDGSIYGYTWQLCNVTAGKDYIPCLDNEKAVKKLRTTRHFEHRERHCPEEPSTCLVPVPEGYKKPIEWPKSRDKIWYHNVPHTLLAEVKGHQNWVKVTGEFLTFPGGGTQFIHGAIHYIEFIEEAVPDIAWGKHTRVILDVGCGVASFGGFLFEKDVITMSFAPKDEHEAQVQFALERGIPAISAVMGSQRLPFPSRVFDLLHCARCRVPWHVEGGALLLELNRVLRPGGYFAWSATPVYQTLEEDVEIWKEMSALTKKICWELITIKKDKLNSVGVAIYRKASSNECYDQRKHNKPLMCKTDDDPNAAWYVALQSCMHRVPEEETERGSRWPVDWPSRLQTPPYWLNKSQMGIYGKPAPDDFLTDYQHWKRVVSKTYLSGLGISWANVRNIMDMRAVYGGFAAAMKDLKVWVMNVVNIDSPDTLPIIYERGLFGIYHDWCESFSTYPRTYDLLHADHLFSKLKKRCKIGPVMAEVDRIVRPGGKLIVRDESATIGEVENLLKSMHWEVHLTFSKNQEGILSAQKSDWRPDTYAPAS
ncbi:hypothetical protein ACSBR1_025337 [Camellia fascicularis]